MTIRNRKLLHELRRFIEVAAGSMVALFGTVLTIRANLGRNPWDVFYQGVALHTPLSDGQVSILASLVIVAICMAYKYYPSFGMIGGAFLDGFWLDFWLEHTEDMPAPKNLFWAIVLLVVGLVITGIGACMFMKQGLGSGPKDTLMVLSVKKFNTSVAVVKLALEGGVCLIGWLLDGHVGIGTVLSVALIGVITEAVFKIGRYDVKAVHQENLLETARNLRNIWNGKENGENE